MKKFLFCQKIRKGGLLRLIRGYDSKNGILRVSSTCFSDFLLNAFSEKIRFNSRAHWKYSEILAFTPFEKCKQEKWESDLR